MRRLSRAGRRTRARGQSLVEFSVSVPVFVLLLFGMLEFGFAFNHNMTLEYATREGARTGAALANGTTTVPCARVVGVTPGVDDRIIAAVQRVLTSPGSPVPVNQILGIRIYRATTSDNSGNEDPGKVNVWVPGAGMTVDGVPLKFTESSVGWSCSTRDNGATPDSIGVSLTYTYHLISPLGIFLGMTGSATFQMSDRTVMALNPN